MAEEFMEIPHDETDGMSAEESKSVSDKDLCVVFICSEKTGIPHQIGKKNALKIWLVSFKY